MTVISDPAESRGAAASLSPPCGHSGHCGFNEAMFFWQQCEEDNKPADLSCGFQLCQPTANNLKTLAAVYRNNSRFSGDGEKPALRPGGLFVFTEPSVWSLSEICALSAD